MHRNPSSVIVIALLLVGAPVASSGMNPTERPTLGPHVAGEILLKFKAGTKDTDKIRARAGLNARLVRHFHTGAEHWRLGVGMTVEKALDILEHNPRVEYAEPNYLLIPGEAPTDPLFPQQWQLHNTGQTGGTPDADIDAPEAWDIETGDNQIVVAILDTAIEYFHPDLTNNMLPGWDFAYGDADPSPYDLDPGDPCLKNLGLGRPGVVQHATQIAGLIGAEANNGEGVAGVNWTVKMLPLQILPGATSNAVPAINYAVQNGADVINASWTAGNSSTIRDAIEAAGQAGVVFVAAAMNNAHDNDTHPTYPASYDLDNVIAVASTDHNDLKAATSNFGLVSVDLGAPGFEVFTTIPQVDEYCPGDPLSNPPRYGEGSGTSMAAPHVAGVVALMKAADPTASVAEIKCSLLKAVDPVPSLTCKTVTGGRLNARRALDNLLDPDPCVLPDPFQFTATIQGSPNPNEPRVNLVSLPYGNVFQGPNGSEDLCQAFELSNNATVSQYDGLGGKLTHECGNPSTVFALLDLKGVEIIERHPGTKQGVIEGWDIPDTDVPLEDDGPGQYVGHNLFPVHFNGTARTPEDLCCQCGLSGTAMITRFDAATGQVHSHICGQIPVWNLVEGEAVLIEDQNAPDSCRQLHY